MPISHFQKARSLSVSAVNICQLRAFFKWKIQVGEPLPQWPFQKKKKGLYFVQASSRFHALLNTFLVLFFLQIGQGDIICYQKSSKSLSHHAYPSVQIFFKRIHDLKAVVPVLYFSISEDLNSSSLLLLAWLYFQSSFLGFSLGCLFRQYHHHVVYFLVWLFFTWLLLTCCC